MKLTPRKYQSLAAEAGIKALKYNKNNTMISAPTASGKSIIISEICHQLDDATLILQPTKEILEQNYAKLQAYEIEDIGVYSASMKRREVEKYTYATIGSIYKKPELFRQFKYVLQDECHLYNPKGENSMYNSFFRAIGNPKVLGLSATPYRVVPGYYTDPLGEKYYTAKLQVLNRIHPFFFREFCYNITNKSLFDGGYLSPMDYIIPSSKIDAREIALNTTGADFNDKELEDYMNSPKNVAKLVDGIVENDHLAPNNLIFCTSIRHAYNSAERLSSLGYSCEVLTGEMSNTERERILTGLRDGKIKRLFNVGVLTTGADFPGLYMVTLGRPVLSLGLYYQMCGRSIRLDPFNPSKRSTILDPFKLHERFGRVKTIEITKNGYKDEVRTELGVMTGVPLFNFKINKNE